VNQLSPTLAAAAITIEAMSASRRHRLADTSAACASPATIPVGIVAQSHGMLAVKSKPVRTIPLSQPERRRTPDRTWHPAGAS
jgi:hypothetical protein